jgi:hypothetical protein
VCFARGCKCNAQSTGVILNFLAFRRKFNPPVSRLLVDFSPTPSAATLTAEALLQNPNFPHMTVYKIGQPIPIWRNIFPSLYYRRYAHYKPGYYFMWISLALAWKADKKYAVTVRNKTMIDGSA